jgi:hypothetical protein
LVRTVDRSTGADDVLGRNLPAGPSSADEMTLNDEVRCWPATSIPLASIVVGLDQAACLVSQKILSIFPH